MAKILNLALGVLAGGLMMVSIAGCGNECEWDDTLEADDAECVEPSTETCAVNADIMADDAECKACTVSGLTDLWYKDAACVEPPDFFKPYQVAMDSSVGYKAADGDGFGQLADWSIDGETNKSTIDIIVYDERYDTTQNIEFLCSLELELDYAKATTGYADFKFDLGNGEKDYHHFGFVSKAGDFTVANAPIQTQAGEIAGCLDKEFDPMIWGDDFGALFAEQDWGLGWGNMAPAIATNFDGQEDDPANDWDTYDLYNGGYIIGGSNVASAYVGQGPIFYTFGYATGADMALIPTENEDNPYERLLGGEMVPAEDGPPKTGVMQVRGAYIWFAKPLLLGVPQQ